MASELSAYVNEVFGTVTAPEKPEFPVLFVGPLGVEVPDDGVFTYTTINNLCDVGTVAERSVILFTEAQADILSVLAKNADGFARSIQPLFGIPNCKYDVWFDDAVFGKDRIAYGVFVAELRNASEMADQLRASSASGTDREREKFSKANGDIRFNKTIGAGDDSDVDE